MTESILVEIIRSCLEQDRMAEDLYSRFSRSFADQGLSCFWTAMAGEKKAHVSFWEALLDYSRQGYLPQLFERPMAVLEELAANAGAVRRFTAMGRKGGDASQAFILGFRLESALLHPAFQTLYRFAFQARLPLSAANPEEGYDRHLGRFLEAVAHFGRPFAEMELLGEMLLQLWRETRAQVFQAQTDGLTGLLNRRRFFTVIGPLAFMCLRDGEPVGMLLVDLDDFKAVNLAHGYQLGDKVLASVSAALGVPLGPRDILGRHAGEEFIAFLPGHGQATLSAMAENLRAAVERTPHHGVMVTVSVGAAHRERLHALHEVEGLIHSADRCLNDAKRQGPNTVSVSPRSI